MKKIKNLTAAEILKQIKLTVICDEEITETNVCDGFSTWFTQFDASNPYEAFTPESCEYFQNKLFVAFAAGMLPAEVTETRTNEVGPDGCWVFTVETAGTLNPYEETEEETEETETETASPSAPSATEETTETAEQVEETETEETETETASPSAPSANEETAAEEQTTDTEEEEEEEIMFTNYTEAVTEDAAQYIRDNYTAEEIAEKLTDREEFAETLNDEMWVADEVTGNVSGSYTFDRMKAREYVLHDIAAVRLALREFATPADTIAEKFLAEDWEYFDVTARCYVLGQAIDAALDIIEAEIKAA